MSRPVLRFGATDEAVATLVDLLTAQGFAPPGVTSATPKFGRAIEIMVIYFQMTHIDQDGEWLEADGVVGSKTWWALENASGEPQRSFLEFSIPAGLTDERRAVLEAAVREHGIREDPNGSNRGPEVDKFLPPAERAKPGKQGPAWCCFFTWWVTREVFGSFPFGERVGSCWGAWRRSVKAARWEPNDGRAPTPGDAFVILHADPAVGWCTGHIGFVLQVAADGRSINTVEGNCGNRVKIGRRSLDDPQLRGFINFWADHPDFERGSLHGLPDLGGDGTR